MLLLEFEFLFLISDVVLLESDTLRLMCQILTMLHLKLKMKRWLVGLKIIQLEQQKTQLPFIIFAKNLKPMSAGW